MKIVGGNLAHGAEGYTVSVHGCRNPPSGLEKGRQQAYGKGRGFIASSQVSALHVRVATTERWMLCPGQPSRCWKVRIVKGPTVLPPFFP